MWRQEGTAVLYLLLFLSSLLCFSYYSRRDDVVLRRADWSTGSSRSTYTTNTTANTAVVLVLVDSSSSSTSSGSNSRSIVVVLHCVSKRVPTFKLSVTFSNLNEFSKFLHCWKAYEIWYKTHKILPTSPQARCYTTLKN